MPSTYRPAGSLPSSRSVAQSETPGVDWDAPSQTGAITYAYETAPPDIGLLAWTYDPQNVANTITPTAGNLYGHKVLIPVAMTVSKIGLIQKAAGTGATSLANCFVALYDATGTRLGVSADQASTWAATIGSGYRAPSLTADAPGSLTLAAGTYVYAAHLIVTQSTTVATFAGRAQGTSQQANTAMLDAAGTGFAAQTPPQRSWIKAGQTSVPTSVDLSTVTPAPSYWAGLA